MLEVRDVSVTFGTTKVLTGVDLMVARHEVVALLGASGSGKSTLLRVIAGLVTPDAGDVSIDGVSVTRLPTHRRNVGLVFQDEQLFPHRTVAQNIEFGLRMQGVDRPARRARVDSLLDLIGLPEFADRRVTDLSGGEAKRVALARTLAPSPAIVLLDEPLTGLDRDLHDQLAVEIAATLRATGTTAVLVTHDPDEATTVADRIVEMRSLQR